MNLRPLCVIVLCHVMAATAGAHYLWIVADSKGDGKGNVSIYFEESAAPRDGHYLDPFVAGGKTWIRTIDSPEPKLVPTREETAPNKRWIVGELPAEAPRSVETYFKFGVYAYGKTNVLLHYYAKHLDLDAHEALHELGRAEHMDIDIVPHDFGNKLNLKVLWKGKPATARTVYIRGPKGFKQNPKTNEKGSVQIDVKEPGVYTFRTYVELDSAGEDGGKEYSLIRHHATLRMKLPLEK